MSSVRADAKPLTFVFADDGLIPNNPLATKDGVALIEAVLKIENPALRRAVIEITEKFAELQLGRSKVPAPRASNVTRLHDDRRPRQRGNRRAQPAAASGEPAPDIGRQE